MNDYTRIVRSTTTVALLVILFLFPNYAVGQNSDSSYIRLTEGKTALQFRINGNFTLGDFTGALISIQKKLSERNAIRWGLTLGAHYRKRKSHNPYSIEGYNEKNFHLGILMNYLWYVRVYKQIRFYYGAGPVLNATYDHSYNKTTLKTLNPNLHTRTDSYNLVGHLAVQGVCGIEYFVARNTGFSIEYVPSAEFDYTRTITRSHNQSSVDSEIYDTYQRGIYSTTGFAINPSSVRFGISIYF